MGMKHRLHIAVFTLLALLACEKKAPHPPQEGVTLDQASIQVHFSPGGTPTAALVGVLNDANESVLVQAYSFTSAPITDALVHAHRRGVKVAVVLDKSHRAAKNSSTSILQGAGIPVWIDEKHAIAHNKVMVIDGRVVVTGSFNFSKAAEERNAENMLIITNRRLAGIYTSYWESHREHSVNF